MGKEKTRVKKAMELALEHLEYIIDHRTTPDFVEITGRVGVLDTVMEVEQYLQQIDAQE